MNCTRCGREIPANAILGVCLAPSSCWDLEMADLWNPTPKAEPQPQVVPADDVAKRARETLIEGVKEAAASQKPKPVKEEPEQWVKDLFHQWEVQLGMWPDELPAASKEKLKPAIENPPAKAAGRDPEPKKVKPADPEPAPVAKARGYHHARNTAELGRKIAHWLADHGGTTKPIARSRVYRALTLARHHDWRDAIREMEDRQIIRTVKGKLLVNAERLMDFELSIARKQGRKKQRKPRPQTSWFKTHVLQAEDEDGGEENAGEDVEAADEFTGQDVEESQDEWSDSGE
jgi:hypothetical protein